MNYITDISVKCLWPVYNTCMINVVLNLYFKFKKKFSVAYFKNSKSCQDIRFSEQRSEQAVTAHVYRGC